MRYKRERERDGGKDRATSVRKIGRPDQSIDDGVCLIICACGSLRVGLQGGGEKELC